MRDFLVMTVDIKDSTKLIRNEMSIVSREISEIILESKDLFRNTIFSSGFTTGDEFEIALESPANFFELIYYIRGKLTAEFRMGIGLGIIESPNEFLDPNQMWGSAFTRARTALNRAKEKDVEIFIITYNNNINNQLNTILNLLFQIRKNLTINQKKIIDQYNYYIHIQNRQLQKDFANQINVSSAMVSKTLKKSGHKQLQEGEYLIQQILCDFFNRIVPLTEFG